MMLRSVLYAPGHKDRVLAKALTTGADAVIFDLEDAVAPATKPAARQQVLAALQASSGSRVTRTVRINAPHSVWWREDLATVLPGQPDAIVIPKVERADDLDAIAHNCGDLPLWAMIESPLGVLHAAAIAAHPRVTVLIAGTSDLSEQLHVELQQDRLPLLLVLQQLVLAARAAGVLVLDGVFLNIHDDDGFRRQCIEAVRFGFDGKTVIHPSQVEAANTLFTPSAEQVAHAQRIMTAWSEADGRGEAICLLDGRLVEQLHMRDAARILALWQSIADRTA
ncbi:MAG: CoA ester lyase [Magnetococcales bacterium]|nr:CoA ester lyase [Magnetococcales bacterium]